MGHGGGTQSYPITEKGIEYPLAVVCVCVRIPRRWNNKSLLLFAEKLKKYRKNKRMMTIGQATTHTHTQVSFFLPVVLFFTASFCFNRKKKLETTSDSLKWTNTHHLFSPNQLTNTWEWKPFSCFSCSLKLEDGKCLPNLFFFFFF
jgi:hypothetical protein